MTYNEDPDQTAPKTENHYGNSLQSTETGEKFKNIFNATFMKKL